MPNPQYHDLPPSPAGLIQSCIGRSCLGPSLSFPGRQVLGASLSCPGRALPPLLELVLQQDEDRLIFPVWWKAFALRRLIGVFILFCGALLSFSLLRPPLEERFVEGRI